MIAVSEEKLHELIREIAYLHGIPELTFYHVLWRGGFWPADYAPAMESQPLSVTKSFGKLYYYDSRIPRNLYSVLSTYVKNEFGEDAFLSVEVYTDKYMGVYTRQIKEDYTEDYSRFPVIFKYNDIDFTNENELHKLSIFLIKKLKTAPIRFSFRLYEAMDDFNEKIGLSRTFEEILNAKLAELTDKTKGE